MATATPTFAEWVAQFKRDVKYLETIYQAGATVTDDLIGQEDTIIQNLEGNTRAIAAVLDALGAVRDDINDAISVSGLTLLEQRILSVRPIIASTATDVQGTIDDLVDYMVTNNEWFESRDFTRGSWTAGGSNTGDGEIIRCTVDADGLPIENTHSEVITATIVANAGGGRDGLGATDPGSEIFRFVGETLGDDALDLEQANRGSGLSIDLPCKRSGDSLVLNPSFSDYTGTGASITDISNWTVTTDIGNFEQDTTNYFVEDESENGTPASLKITATDTIEQKLSVSGNSFDDDAPYLCQIKYNRAVGSGSGTLELHLGTQSVSVAVSAQTGWNTLRLTVDQNSWFENFDNDEDTSVKVVWTRTSGDILIDDIRLVKFDSFGNLPTVGLGGATRWRIGDTGTFTDTETGKIVERWLWRLFDRYVANAPAANQVTAAGGRTLTFADSGGSDTITASSGDFTTEGYQVGMIVTIAGTSSNNMTTGPLATVTATVLTFGSGTSLTNEGPLSSTATLDATANNTDPSVSF